MRHLVALGLPVCLLWMLVGCVSICASEVEATHQPGAASLAIDTGDSHDSDCCPLVASFSVLPERLSATAGDTLSLSHAFVIGNLATPPGAKGRPSHSSLDPPLKRLCTLRI